MDAKSLDSWKDEDLLEFLDWQEQKVKAEFEAKMAAIAQKRAALNGQARAAKEGISESPKDGTRSRRLISGWKGLIDKVLEEAGKPLGSREIMDTIAMQNPEVNDRYESGFKSVTSTLAAESKPGGRYVKTIVSGKGQFTLKE